MRIDKSWQSRIVTEIKAETGRTRFDKRIFDFQRPLTSTFSIFLQSSEGLNQQFKLFGAHIWPNFFPLMSLTVLLLLKIEKSRHVRKSRPVCVSLYNKKTRHSLGLALK